MTYAWGPETGFFYENTSFVLEDEVKNPVSLSKCVQDSEYKFNRRPINLRETTRRCIQISGNIVSGCMGTIKSRSIIPHSPTPDFRLPTPNHSGVTGFDITGKINRIGW